MNDLSGPGVPQPQNRDQLSGRLRSSRSPARYRAMALALVFVAMGFGIRPALAQSMPTATRVGDLQLGGGFVFATSNYNFTPTHLVGGGFYATFDKRNHWGGEVDFRQIRSSADSTVYERTYEIGPRIFLARGPFIPYAKVLYGRGIYNFSGNAGNLAYNMLVYGGGVDLRIRRSINVRADYEYQNWYGFPLGTLHPNVVTIGVAYHFHE